MSVQTFLNNRVTLHCGDCLKVLATLPENSVDSVACDPPYHLTSIVKRFGAENAAPAKVGKTGAYARASAGFMGKQWDGGDIAFRPELWVAVCRVLKPGAHLIAFSATRTYHRMVCAIEDAGFEIRDQIGWAYGSGFPKSHNLNGVYQGWGTALKPAWEPICLARKPLIGTVAENVLTYGTGALNIDGCRVGAREKPKVTDAKKTSNTYGAIDSPGGKLLPDARWPANVIHDGSEEVLAAFPEAPGQLAAASASAPSRRTQHVYGSMKRGNGRDGEATADRRYTDEGSTNFAALPGARREDGGGSAARFFYTAKADAEDRLGSKHPTVKPLDLMQYLVRLVTPKGGTVLDPFAGTGTTGEAAWREGMYAVLIEREPEYQADIARRMDLAAKPTKRAAVAKTKNHLDDPNALPLFARVSV